MEELEGRWQFPRWWRGLYLVGLPLVVLLAVAERTLPVAGVLLMWLMHGLTVLRGPVRVTRETVSVPRAIPLWRRRIRWDTVEGVKSPGRWDTTTTLLMVDGESVDLDGIGPRCAAAVAGIGGKKLLEQPTPSPPGGARHR